MKNRIEIVGFAGMIAAATPNVALAQQPQSSTPSTPTQVGSQTPTTGPSSGAPPVAPLPSAGPAELRGPDGKPLTPEQQKRLLEQLNLDPAKFAQPGTVGAQNGGGPVRSGDVLVLGKRPRGSVIGDIQPERTFNPLDLRAYGANDIGELLQTLTPQLTSNRGRDNNGPVVLINGKRVSSTTEIAKIPAEAIERLEVLPEEVSLKYGYRADQKVVNIVLFERFNSKIGQLSSAIPTEGGRESISVNANYYKISGDTRYNLDTNFAHSNRLLENDRNIRQLGAPNLGNFRTLLPSTDQFTVNGTVSTTLLRSIASTLNAKFDLTNNFSLLGLNGSTPLRRSEENRTVHIGATFATALGSWQATLTGNYDRLTTFTATDAANSTTGPSTARSANSAGEGTLLITGSPLRLPAGGISASLRVGIDQRDQGSDFSAGANTQRTDLSRGRQAVQLNLDFPLANRAAQVLPLLGTLSVNGNIEVEHLSDFGDLRTYGYGLNWSPTPAVSFVASVTNEQGPPTVLQLGAPRIVTPNVRSLDFLRLETVDITQIYAGNRALRADERRITRLALTLKPLAASDFSLSIDYVNTRIENPIATFPIATGPVQAAFPERFTRDASGRLTQIDATPVNFRRSDQQQLRWGLNFTRPLGNLPMGLKGRGAIFVSSESEIQRRLPQGSKVVKVEPTAAQSRAIENATSRVFLTFYHSWRLEDTLVLRDGLPALDLLDGFALDPRGGRPRHSLELQAGIFKGGLGGRFTANWQSDTLIRGVSSAAGGIPGDLRFAAIATVNLDFFANIGDRLGGPKAPKWLRGTRASLSVRNLFNARPLVRDAAGQTPLAYQQSYLNPLGRVLTLTLRKVF